MTARRGDIKDLLAAEADNLSEELRTKLSLELPR